MPNWCNCTHVLFLFLRPNCCKKLTLNLLPHKSHYSEHWDKPYRLETLRRQLMISWRIFTFCISGTNGLNWRIFTLISGGYLNHLLHAHTHTHTHRHTHRHTHTHTHTHRHTHLPWGSSLPHPRPWLGSSCPMGQPAGCSQLPHPPVAEAELGTFSIFLALSTIKRILFDMFFSS